MSFPLVFLYNITDAVDLDDIEMLEDMVLAATNEALKKAQEMMTQELGKLTGGLNIPGLF